MRKSLLIVCGVIVLGFSSFGQEAAKEAIKVIQECQCNEIVMISGALTKSYGGVWLEGVEYDNGMITFSKGIARHKWNAEKIVFVERDRSFVRVYLEQAK